jgi:hexosaminidase
LADVVEPVKDYTREATATAEPTSATPLNRVVDAVPLESDVVRRFGVLVDKFISSSCRDAEATAQLRAQLSAWRDNDVRLQPLTRRSFLVKEVAATSQDLSSVATVGLAALDFVAKGGIAPEDWKTQQLAVIEQIEKPKSQLLVMPAPAIQKLVESVAAGGSCATPR